MTTVKCNKHKCYYNIEGICSHRKINLRYFKCLNYTRDDKVKFQGTKFNRCKTNMS